MNYPTYLIHYGIPGQKWGVRRFQNEDGTWTDLGKRLRRTGDSEALVLPKGTSVNRVSMYKKDKLKGSKYLYTDIDKDIYEGAFSTYLKYRYGDKRAVYKKTYETKEDLIAPSEKKAREIVENRMKDKNVSRNVNNMASILVMRGMAQAREVLNNNNIKIDESKGNLATAYAYEDVFSKSSKEVQDKILNDLRWAAYNSMVENNKRELNAMLKEVSKQGYNSILDYNNVKIYNEAAESFIVINSKKTLKEINNKRLEDEYIKETYEKVRKKMEAKGKKISL